MEGEENLSSLPQNEGESFSQERIGSPEEEERKNEWLSWVASEEDYPPSVREEIQRRRGLIEERTERVIGRIEKEVLGWWNDRNEFMTQQKEEAVKILSGEEKEEEGESKMKDQVKLLAQAWKAVKEGRDPYPFLMELDKTKRGLASLPDERRYEEMRRLYGVPVNWRERLIQWQEKFFRRRTYSREEKKFLEEARDCVSRFTTAFLSSELEGISLPLEEDRFFWSRRVDSRVGSKYPWEKDYWQTVREEIEKFKRVKEKVERLLSFSEGEFSFLREVREWQDVLSKTNDNLPLIEEGLKEYLEGVIDKGRERMREVVRERIAKIYQEEKIIDEELIPPSGWSLGDRFNPIPFSWISREGYERLIEFKKKLGTIREELQGIFSFEGEFYHFDRIISLIEGVLIEGKKLSDLNKEFSEGREENTLWHVAPFKLFLEIIKRGALLSRKEQIEEKGEANFVSGGIKVIKEKGKMVVIDRRGREWDPDEYWQEHCAGYIKHPLQESHQTCFSENHPYLYRLGIYFQGAALVFSLRDLSSRFQWTEADGLHFFSLDYNEEEGLASPGFRLDLSSEESFLVVAEKGKKAEIERAVKERLGEEEGEEWIKRHLFVIDEIKKEDEQRTRAILEKVRKEFWRRFRKEIGKRRRRGFFVPTGRKGETPSRGWLPLYTFRHAAAAETAAAFP